MKNQPRKKHISNLFAISLVLLLASLGGCQDREVALSIVSVQPYDNMKSSKRTGYQVGGGVDLAMRNTYQANLMLGNNLVDVPNAKGLNRLMHG